MFTSWAFWLLVLPAAALLRLLPDSMIRWRAALLALAGACGILTIVGLPPWTGLMLAACIAWISWGASRARDRPGLGLALLTIAPVLGLWMVGKYAVAAEVTRFKVLYFMGFSYFLVKAWTLVKDCNDGRVPAYDPIVGAAYFLHLPVYPTGPMHYYSEFESSLRKPQALSAVATVDIVFRFLWGLLKVSVLAPLFHPLSLLALQGGPEPTLSQLVWGGFGYSIVLYLDFSGFADMAIALSRLMGVAAPENFALPYLKPNIREFWQSWHITFTRALTGYIFVPLSRFLQTRFPKSPRTVMTIGYLVTFGFAGYWHGPTANFIFWGLYHATGLVAYDLYRRWRLRLPKAPTAKTAQPAVAHIARACSVAATFTFVSLGWILFVPTRVVP